jgi:hypothetical protein
LSFIGTELHHDRSYRIGLHGEDSTKEHQQRHLSTATLAAAGDNIGKRYQRTSAGGWKRQRRRRRRTPKAAAAAAAPAGRDHAAATSAVRGTPATIGSIGFYIGSTRTEFHHRRAGANGQLDTRRNKTGNDRRAAEDAEDLKVETPKTHTLAQSFDSYPAQDAKAQPNTPYIFYIIYFTSHSTGLDPLHRSAPTP